MDKQKLERLKAELPLLRVHNGDTFTMVCDKLVRLADTHIELALAAIEATDGRPG